MDANIDIPRWTRLPVLPRKFCIGITIETAMLIIAWLFLVLGIIMFIGFSVGFWLHNYYTSEAESIVDFTTLKLKMKIEEGYILSIFVTAGLGWGICMDTLLLYAIKKSRLGLQAAWAVMLFLRMIYWVAVGSMLWGRCIRGGRMCYVLLPAAMMWAASLGVFSVVIVVTYSHLFYIYFDDWVLGIRLSSKAITSSSSSEETSEEDSV